jgi:hypothetical protein
MLVPAELVVADLAYHEWVREFEGGRRGLWPAGRAYGSALRQEGGPRRAVRGGYSEGGRGALCFQ